jgi:hypothetical protein
MSLELLIMGDGSAMLTDDGALCWSSDADDTFLEEFELPVNPDDADDLLEYLEDEGYIEPGDDVNVIVDDDDVDTVNGEALN